MQSNPKDRLTELLQKYIHGDSLPPILTDESGVCIAISTLRQVSISHIDELYEMPLSEVYVFEAESGKKTLSIEIIRKIIDTVAFSTIGDNRIVIVRDIDRITLQAANALLKTFEDNPTGTLFLCTVTNKELLPDTIISRSIEIMIESTQGVLQTNDISMYDEYLHGYSERLIQYIYEQDKLDQGNALVILGNLLRSISQERILLGGSAYALIEEAIQNLHETNVSPKYIIDDCLFRLHSLLHVLRHK